MKKIMGTLIAVFGLVGGVYGFIQYRAQAKQERVSQQTKLRVVTTNSILEDMVHNVGQDHIELYSIVKRGTDPHEYEPQPTDISKTTDADVVFHNGLNLETGGNGWFKKLVKIAHKKFEKDVFAASKGIQVQHLTTNATEPDPHAWLDLANGMQYVENITKALQTKDPAHADDYRHNADQYLARLRQLHTAAQAKFADSDVKHLFVESSVSPKSMEKVAQETGLPIYAKIFTDSLAQSGKPGDTYYTMMKWNLDKIHDGLVGQ